MTKTKKILIPIIAILVLASVVGIGFAAWLIVNPINQDVEGGSFVADEVHDYTYTASAAATTTAPADKANSIIFGKGDAPATDYGWLSAADVPADVLTATITVTLDPTDDNLTVDNNTAAKLLNGNKLMVAVSYLGVKSGDTTYTKKDAFNSAVTAGYLANPTLTVGSTNKTITEAWGDKNLYVELEASNFTANADGKTLSATVTLTFAWGSNGNPYTHYNGQAYTKELASEASTMLTAIRELNEGKYQIHLETVAPSTGA